MDIQLNELSASVSDEKAHVHVSIDADMSKEELMKILKNRFKLRGLSQQWLFLLLRKIYNSYYGETVSSLVKRPASVEVIGSNPILVLFYFINQERGF